MAADGGGMRQIVGEVRKLLSQYGAVAFGDRERTGAYLRRRFPHQADEVEACLTVLYLPRFLDCLIWLQNDPAAGGRAAQCWAHYESMLPGGADAPARSANRLFLLE